MKLEALVAAGCLFLLAMAAAADADAAARTSVTLHDGWTFRQVGREEWYPARVPGVVHLDLFDNGLIGDPFYRDYERGLQWIGKTDWEYRAEFVVPPDIREAVVGRRGFSGRRAGRRNVEIVFDGLDTYARVFLNGKLVLEADNFYRQWRVPVLGNLRDGRNELRIVFRSPINEDLPKVAARGYELPAVNDQGEKTSVYTRKAPYQFGWDWGPRLVTCGIWKPVRLEAWDDARIVDVFLKQEELGKDRARLTAEVEVLARRPANGALPPTAIEVTVEGFAGPAATVKIPLREGARTHKVPFEIPSPRLWWPNGYGEQPLYTVKTRLLMGGRAVDEARDRIGLRTLELHRAGDPWGKSFEFVVNGVPVFAKGANWIPADSFLPRITRERYAQLLGSARDAHMNMLRVWGGGIYESDVFYELADEMGLLLWQDFHFSCSLYPADKKFLKNVEVEAEQAVRRLRNHPSLALWNGNNEMEAGWFQWGWKERFPGWLWSDYQAIFHEMLPKVVARFDPTRSYWPSSPSANREAAPGDPGNGDMHYWGVWHGAEPFSAFERQKTRFMSEYGFQSFPEMKTIRSFARWDDLAIDSPVMMSHQKHPRGNQLIREYMLRDYREPKDFPSFLYVSQVLQAEGIKLGAEYLRRSRPRTMGSLYWQLDDCWPVASWASIDYFGRWKALQYYARRFYAALLVSTSEEDGQVDVHVVSDLVTPVAATLEVRLLDLAGVVVWEKKQDVTVAPLASEKHLSIPRAELLSGREASAVFLHVRLVADGRALAENARFFVPPKDMALRKPQIKVETTPAEGGFKATLSTDILARHVRLVYAPDDGSFSDNYFDLVPGRPVEVTYRTKGVVEPEAFKKGLEVVSIVDAFAARP
jgi:beta-mannosidase